MKILILLNAYKDDGPGNLMLSLIRNLMDKGDINYHTAAISRSGPLKPVLEEMLIPTTVIGMKGIYDIKAIIELINYIKKEKFDVIHTNLIRGDIIGRLVGKYLKIPIIITTEHGIHTWKSKGMVVEKAVRWAYKYTTNFTEKIIAVSNFVKNDLIKIGIPEEKIIRIYNGVDTDKFAPFLREEKLKMHSYLADFEFKNLVGVVGNMVSLKGHSYFIEAIPGILKQNPATMFVLIGEGPLKEDLETLVAQKRLSDRAKFLGHLSAILPKVTSSMDVLVQPSLTESFGMTVAEAQSCAIPVVGSNIGGIPEIIVDGKTGFLVEPGNPAQIAEKVNYLLSNPDKAFEIGREGRRHIIEHFNIEQTASSYYQLYKTLFSKISKFQPKTEEDVENKNSDDNLE